MYIYTYTLIYISISIYLLVSYICTEITRASFL